MLEVFFGASLWGEKTPQISCYSRVVAKFEIKEKNTASLSNIIKSCIFFCR